MTASAADWIDTDRLDELTAIVGRANVDRLLTLYRSGLRDTGSELSALLAARDVGGLRSRGHHMRGAALNLGCHPIAEAAAALSLCDQATMAARTHDLDRVARATLLCIDGLVDAA